MLDYLDINYCSNLETIDLTSSKDSLSTLLAAEVKNIGTNGVFDASVFTNLATLNVAYCNLSELKLSGLTKLESLQANNNYLTYLEVPECVPSGTDEYGNSSVYFRYNPLLNAAELAERFGEDSVSSLSDCGVLTDLDISIGQMSYYATEYYFASHLDDVSFLEEDDAWNPENFTIASSDANVVEVSASSGTNSDYGEPYVYLTFIGKKYGTAVVTIEYSYKDYSFTCMSVIEVSEPETYDTITALTPSATSTNVYYIDDCTVCGGSHSQNYDVFYIMPVTENGGEESPNTTLVARSEDSSIIDSVRVSSLKTSEGYAISLNAVKPGTTTITIDAFDSGVVDENGSQPSIASTSVEVTVVESDGVPTIKQNTEKVVLDVSGSTYNTSYEVMSPETDEADAYGIWSYEYDEVVSLLRHSYDDSGSFLSEGSFAENAYPSYFFNGKEITFFSAESSNTNVVAVEENAYSTLSLVPKGVGTATITLKDLWGHTSTCEVEIKDYSSDVTKVIESGEITLTEDEITVTEGETVDLSQYVNDASGLLKNMIIIAETSNGYIAPLKWSNGSDTRNVSDFSLLLGRNEGTVEVTLSVLASTNYEGYLPTEASHIEIGTMTVNVEAPAVAVESVSVSSAETAMTVGATQQLSATVLPAEASQTVTWTSSDTSVLSVDSKGLVTAVGNGTATITATAGEKSATTDAITVTTPVEGVTLSSESLSLVVGGSTSTLIATVQPSTASNTSVTWSSSDESVATVDNGVVTPVGAGTATITVTTADGSKTATCNVTVVQNVTGISLDKTELALVGSQTAQLNATIAPDTASNKNVSWTSSDEAVATVSAEGLVTSVGKGNATITATSEDGSFTATCAVTVSNPATSLTLDQSEISLTKGNTATITATLTGALSGAVDEDTANIEWTSSNTDAATVAGSGASATVTATKTGTATVTATLGNLSASCAVSVSNPVTGVSLSETSKSVTVGDSSFTLSATVTPSDADDATVTWTSSDSSVASVESDGTVTVGKAGTATITATAGDQSATCAVTVNAKQVATTSSDSGITGTVTISDPEQKDAFDTALEKAGVSLSDISLKVEAVSDDPEETATAENALSSVLSSSSNELAEVLDFSFVNASGEEVNVGNVNMTVAVELTDSMKGYDTLQVYYISDDGTATKCDSWVADGKLYFNVEHFSTYAVVGSVNDQSGNPGGGSNTTTTTTTETVTTTEDKAGTAKTGDTFGMGAVAVGALAVAAAAGLVLARRKVQR